jgi:L-lactate dehydrogenase complex protein LldF
MQVKSSQFKRVSTENLNNATLQRALTRLHEKFVVGRLDAISELDDYEGLREAGAEIRDRAVTHLDLHLERFEQEVKARGGIVCWAADAADANRHLLEIATRHGVRKIVKSKSMVSEECAVNEHLEAHGLEVVETDLGEYILQLAKEPPSHIVAPVIHKHKEQIADLFADHHHTPRKTDIAALCREARETLRSAFLSADMGISGANFIVAETGSVAIVTNEGNGRLSTTLPRVHVAITGIEKVVPTLDDLTILLRILPPSATGQLITNYVSVLTGPRRSGDTDGPDHFYVILVDNGRSRLLGTDLQSMLRCIRCGACMNHCPVYQNIGGHAYGWVYPGPMGSVLTPNFVGIKNALDLPNASTFCGKCADVCPVKIPLPDLLRRLRERQFTTGLRPWPERIALRIWRWVALRPGIYAAVTRWSMWSLHRLGGARGRFRWLPGASGWTSGRDFPAPAGRTFRDLYRGSE